jgi:putative tryptophan/tyrosine transport system substrate-binding protein
LHETGSNRLFGDAAAHAAQAATTSIPIVAQSEDLVRANLVISMRQPEGNLTGVSIMGTELDSKRLEILAEILPKRSAVLLLADPTTHLIKTGPQRDGRSVGTHAPRVHRGHTTGD